jgi:hypothetical protein
VEPDATAAFGAVGLSVAAFQTLWAAEADMAAAAAGEFADGLRRAADAYHAADEAALRRMRIA